MLCSWKFKNCWTKFRVCSLIIVELEELSNFWHLIIPIFKPCIIISAMWDDDLSIFVFKLIEHKPNILRLGETFDGFSYDFYKKPAKICIFLLNFAVFFPPRLFPAILPPRLLPTYSEYLQTDSYNLLYQLYNV